MRTIVVEKPSLLDAVTTDPSADTDLHPDIRTGAFIGPVVGFNSIVYTCVITPQAEPAGKTKKVRVVYSFDCAKALSGNYKAARLMALREALSYALKATKHLALDIDKRPRRALVCAFESLQVSVWWLDAFIETYKSGERTDEF